MSATTRYPLVIVYRQCNHDWVLDSLKLTVAISRISSVTYSWELWLIDLGGWWITEGKRNHICLYVSTTYWLCLWKDPCILRSTASLKIGGSPGMLKRNIIWIMDMRCLLMWLCSIHCNYQIKALHKLQGLNKLWWVVGMCKNFP